MKLIKLKSRLRNYPIFIERGITAKTDSIVNKYFFSAEKIILITNDKIFSIYRDNIEKFLNSTNKISNLIILKDGESQKNLKNTDFIYRNLVDFNVHRNDLIIAFGGGVIGDIAGYAASTFHRGMNLIQFPTTITAQVDSSIGGKVVVNYEAIKNIIGSFYQPHAVIIDPDLLKTLKEREIINGLAEIIKYGVVFNKKILEILKEITPKKIAHTETKPIKNTAGNLKMKNDDSNTDSSTTIDTDLYGLIKNKKFDEIIYRCIKIKVSVVKKDEFDTGYRNLLNYGHTIGHAIEKVQKLKDINHGEAVALGMIAAVDISIELGLAEQSLKNKFLEIYRLLKLPYLFPQINTDELILSMKFDKKFSASQNKFILLRDLNKPVFKYNISADIIKKSILKNMKMEM